MLLTAWKVLIGARSTCQCYLGTFTVAPFDVASQLLHMCWSKQINAVDVCLNTEVEVGAIQSCANSRWHHQRDDRNDLDMTKTCFASTGLVGTWDDPIIFPVKRRSAATSSLLARTRMQPVPVPRQYSTDRMDRTRALLRVYWSKFGIMT